ncbi:FKBP-type peptidyl-prolyl cis-trans isomerase (plasmid) [Symbiopectobacterium sp. Eva_TO]
MMVRLPALRLSVTALVISLLLPARYTRAEDTPPLFRFAPQWLKENASPQASQHHSAPSSPVQVKAVTCTAPEEEQQGLKKLLSAEQEKVKNLRTLIKVKNAREQQCEAVSQERDTLRLALSELQAKEQNAARGVSATPHPDTTTLVPTLKSLQDENSSLTIREKAASAAREEALKQTARLADELAAARSETARLLLENKALVIQDDVKSARLVSLGKFMEDNQRLKSALDGMSASEARFRKEAESLRRQLADRAMSDNTLNPHSAGASVSSASSGASVPEAGKTPSTSQTAQVSGNPEKVRAPDNLADDGLNGDYAAGVAFGREALSAIRMNALLGIPVSRPSLAGGFTDALSEQIRYPESALQEALKTRSREVLLARDRTISAQKTSGEKALRAFRLQSGVVRDKMGYWYRTDAPGDAPLSADGAIHVTVRERLADGTVIDAGSRVSQQIRDFPPLFRSVIARLKLHGSATFLVPPSLAYGDDGFPPRIPPGATMLYTLTINAQDTAGVNATDSAARRAGSRYLEAFMREPGVKKSSSGFWYQIRDKGDGRTIHSTDTVSSVMRESLSSGKVISDMVADKKMFKMPLDRYPEMFREAISLLGRHGAIRVVAPPELAYGDSDTPAGVPPGSTMVYDIRVLDVTGDKTDKRTDK